MLGLQSCVLSQFTCSIQCISYLVLQNSTSAVYMQMYCNQQFASHDFVFTYQQNLVSAITQVSHIGCGYGFTIAAKADSYSLWTTGLNSFSQLGRQLSSSNGQGMCTLHTIFPTEGCWNSQWGPEWDGGHRRPLALKGKH